MPARDRFHEQVRNALLKDGWTITHDPFRLDWDGKPLYADFGAERLIGAEKGLRRIVVEVKNSLSSSEMHDLYEAFGQFAVYRFALSASAQENDRELFLGLRESVFQSLFDEPMGKNFRVAQNLKLLVFDLDQEEVTNGSSNRVSTDHRTYPA